MCSWSYSETFGGGGWKGYNEYLNIKDKRISEQLKEKYACCDDVVPIFKGMLMIRHGGEYESYNLSRVTHIIADNVAVGNQRWRKIRERGRANFFVVTSEWVLASAEKGRKVPESYFTPDSLKNTSSGFGSIFRFVASNESPKKLESPPPTTLHDSSSHTISLSSNSKVSTESPQSLTVENQTIKPRDSILCTDTTQNFVKKFFQASRLHFIGRWRERIATKFMFTNFIPLCPEVVNTISPVPQSTLRQFFTKPNSTEKTDTNHNLQNISVSEILHIDFDAFFVSVALQSHKELQYNPVAVCHGSGNNSGSEIASCNYIARQYGVRKGMWLKDAKEMCHDLQVLPYDFEAIERTSLAMLNVLTDVTSRVLPVSCDEGYVQLVGNYEVEESEFVAEWIREQIAFRTNCNVSIGIGPNLLLAKLGTSRAKPDAGNGKCSKGIHRVTKPYKAYMANIPLSALPGVGWRTVEKLNVLEVKTCDDLISKTTLKQVQELLGEKQGILLYNFCMGCDPRPIPTAQFDFQAIQNSDRSLSVSINWGIRLTTDAGVQNLLSQMAEECADRLFLCNSTTADIVLKVLRRAAHVPVEPEKYGGCGECDELVKKVSLLPHGVFNKECLFGYLYQLWRQMSSTEVCSISDIRGVSICMGKLKLKPLGQTSLSSNALQSSESPLISCSLNTVQELSYHGGSPVQCGVLQPLPHSPSFDSIDQPLSSKSVVMPIDNGIEQHEIMPLSAVQAKHKTLTAHFVEQFSIKHHEDDTPYTTMRPKEPSSLSEAIPGAFTSLKIEQISTLTTQRATLLASIVSPVPSEQLEPQVPLQDGRRSLEKINVNKPPSPSSSYPKKTFPSSGYSIEREQTLTRVKKRQRLLLPDTVRDSSNKKSLKQSSQPTLFQFMGNRRKRDVLTSTDAVASSCKDNHSIEVVDIDTSDESDEKQLSLRTTSSVNLLRCTAAKSLFPGKTLLSDNARVPSGQSEICKLKFPSNPTLHSIPSSSNVSLPISDNSASLPSVSYSKSASVSIETSRGSHSTTSMPLSTQLSASTFLLDSKTLQESSADATRTHTREEMSLLERQHEASKSPLGYRVEYQSEHKQASSLCADTAYYEEEGCIQQKPNDASMEGESLLARRRTKSNSEKCTVPALISPLIVQHQETEINDMKTRDAKTKNTMIDEVIVNDVSEAPPPLATSVWDQKLLHKIIAIKDKMCSTQQNFANFCIDLSDDDSALTDNESDYSEVELVYCPNVVSVNILPSKFMEDPLCCDHNETKGLDKQDNVSPNHENTRKPLSRDFTSAENSGSYSPPNSSKRDCRVHYIHETQSVNPRMVSPTSRRCMSDTQYDTCPTEHEVSLGQHPCSPHSTVSKVSSLPHRAPLEKAQLDSWDNHEFPLDVLALRESVESHARMFNATPQDSLNGIRYHHEVCGGSHQMFSQLEGIANLFASPFNTFALWLSKSCWLCVVKDLVATYVGQSSFQKNILLTQFSTALLMLCWVASSLHDQASCLGTPNVDSLPVIILLEEIWGISTCLAVHRDVDIRDVFLAQMLYLLNHPLSFVECASTMLSSDIESLTHYLTTTIKQKWEQLRFFDGHPTKNLACYLFSISFNNLRVALERLVQEDKQTACSP